MGWLIVRIEAQEPKRSISRKVVACPFGRIPEAVAEQNGGILEDYYASRPDAEWALVSAPTGKVDSWFR